MCKSRTGRAARPVSVTPLRLAAVTLPLLALPYAAHRVYRAEWQP